MTDPRTLGEDALLRGKRVVICEDEALTMLHLARALTRAGLEVVGCAADGTEALRIIRRERPDIVTMDVHLPTLNGLETIRRLRKDYCPCIIVVTAYSGEETRKQAAEAGACGFLSKPVAADEIVNAISAAFRSHQEAAGAPVS